MHIIDTRRRYDFIFTKIPSVRTIIDGSGTAMKERHTPYRWCVSSLRDKRIGKF
ncbi:hypothetical protein WN55_10775 [Dufourea novaeangliae]|uniref:Uncharacterized protein n=1 Tax=Dufourea novaeangliae TaxID=178035 RepID=A0A154PA71_DUFNO|nr:hypothetical protein WN55_10775 [Dufourea novaeangliae]